MIVDAFYLNGDMIGSADVIPSIKKVDEYIVHRFNPEIAFSTARDDEGCFFQLDGVRVDPVTPCRVYEGCTVVIHSAHVLVPPA